MTSSTGTASLQPGVQALHLMDAAAALSWLIWDLLIHFDLEVCERTRHQLGVANKPTYPDTTCVEVCGMAKQVA